MIEDPFGAGTSPYSFGWRKIIDLQIEQWILKTGKWFEEVPSGLCFWFVDDVQIININAYKCSVKMTNLLFGLFAQLN